MSTVPHPEAAGLAEAIWLADDRWQHGVGAGGFAPPETAWEQALAAAALSWLTARLTDDDVVEAAAESVPDAHWCESNYTKGCNCREDRMHTARAALSAAAAVIGGER